MADLRIPTSLPAVRASPPGPAADAVRAAQRAFFDTALANAASPAVTRPAPPTQAIAVAAPPPQRASLGAATQTAEPPSRPMRPGSLLDIRV